MLSLNSTSSIQYSHTTAVAHYIKRGTTIKEAEIARTPGGAFAQYFTIASVHAKTKHGHACVGPVQHACMQSHPGHRAQAAGWMVDSLQLSYPDSDLLDVWMFLNTNAVALQTGLEMHVGLCKCESFVTVAGGLSKGLRRKGGGMVASGVTRTYKDNITQAGTTTHNHIPPLGQPRETRLTPHTNHIQTCLCRRKLSIEQPSIEQPSTPN